MQGLPQIGDVLDDTYRIVSELGKGGFGAVYLARQISMDREVALKVLVANAMRIDEMIQRFRREVMAIRNLGHPNTIRVYDFRDRPDGMLYYAMEYVKGPTLKDVMKEGPMPPRRVHHILRQVLKSLAEAHNFGIVHRDLKPANIMLAQMHGETDFVKVLDFGIAKILDGDDEEREQITSAGVLVGTLNYMSPEQIAGGQITGSSDLYALALIGIEMLSGKSVFEGTGRWEILHKQISDEPVEIPTVVLESPLGPVFQQALQKRPHARFERAEDMLDAMDGIDFGGLRSAPLVTPSEVEWDRKAEGTETPLSHSGPISRSAPISQSGPITGAAPLRDSTPPGAGGFAISPSADLRTEGSAQIRIGTPGAFVDEQTQQVDSSPGFMPPREPVHTPIPSPLPPQREEEPTDEEGVKTMIPGLAAVPSLRQEAKQEAEPQPEPVPAPPMKTAVAREETSRQTIPEVAPEPTRGGNAKLLIAAAAVGALVLVAAGVAVSLLSTDTPAEPETTVTVPEPPQIPVAVEEAPVEVVEPQTDPAPDAPAVEKKQIKVQSGTTRANLFDGETLIGTTPIRFGVGEPRTFTLKAEGFEDATVTLSNESEDTVDVQLEPLVDETAPAAAPVTTKKKKKKDVPFGWVPIEPIKENDKKKRTVDPNGPKAPVF